MMTASATLPSEPPETPSSTVLDKVTIAGTDRSMPRAMITSDCPIAAMARKAAKGNIDCSDDRWMLRGRNSAPSSMIAASATQMARKRI